MLICSDVEIFPKALPGCFEWFSKISIICTNFPYMVKPHMVEPAKIQAGDLPS